MLDRFFSTHRIIALGAMICAPLAGCAAPTADEPPEDASETTTQAATAALTFQIVNIGSRLCLDGYDAGGSNIHPYMYTCDSANPYQRWRLGGGPGYNVRQYCNVATGTCLDGYVSPSGGNPYLYRSIPNNPYQLWTLSDPYFGIGGNDDAMVPFPLGRKSLLYVRPVTGQPARCLDGFATLGKRPYLFACNGDNAYQLWTFK